MLAELVVIYTYNTRDLSRALKVKLKGMLSIIIVSNFHTSHSVKWIRYSQFGCLI